MNDYKTAAEMACKDISSELKGIISTGFGEYTEVWYVSPSVMFTKKTRMLNRVLGINKVNYISNKNGF